MIFVVLPYLHMLYGEGDGPVNDTVMIMQCLYNTHTMQSNKDLNKYICTVCEHVAF